MADPCRGCPRRFHNPQPMVAVPPAAPATATARPGTKVLPTAIKPPGRDIAAGGTSPEDGDPLRRPGSAPGEFRRRPCPHPFLGVIPGRWGGRWWPGTVTPARGQDALLLGLAKAKGEPGDCTESRDQGDSLERSAGTGCATFPITCRGGFPSSLSRHEKPRRDQWVWEPRPLLEGQSGLGVTGNALGHGPVSPGSLRAQPSPFPVGHLGPH